MLQLIILEREMTVDNVLVRRLRLEKGWSQEELAIASDLSARTIQRLESDGGGSRNTFQSVAAALEVNLHNIEDMPRTRSIGFRMGYSGVVIGTACAVIATVADWQSASGFSSYQAGVSMGIVGLIAGLSCAFIGWASSR